MKEKDEIICVSEDQRTALCSIAKISDEEVIADVIQWKEETCRASDSSNHCERIA